MNKISDFKEKLINVGLAKNNEIIGVSIDDINFVEKKFSIELPTVYKDFLAVMGRNAGKLAEDIDFYFPRIIELKNEAEEMIEDKHDAFYLPVKSFVFSAYQGFQYHYFICDGKNDPEVYRLFDGGEVPKKVANSFSEYLISML